MANLPEDIWLAIGTSYLSQRERICLSETCHQLQKLIQPIIFQTVVFCGASDRATHSIRNFFIHVLYLEKRIDFLQQNARLRSYIRTISIVRWLHIPLFWAFHFMCELSDDARDPLRTKLQSLWLATSRKLFHLVSSLHFCTKISLMELESAKWPDIAQLPLDINGRYGVLEAFHVWKCNRIELEFSVPENEEKAHFLKLDCFFQDNLFASEWTPASEEYFREILAAWVLPITKAAVNLRIIKDLPISTPDCLHSLKEFGIAVEERQYLSDIHLGPFKLSPNTRGLSIFATVFSLSCLENKESLKTITFLGGNASTLSQLLHLCPNTVSLYIEETGWSNIKRFISPQMTKNIYELDLGPLLDAGKANAEMATYFPKIRRLTAFRLSKAALIWNVNISPPLQDLFKETLDFCMEFKELEVLWLLFPYKPLVGPERPTYRTRTFLDTSGNSTHCLREIILGAQGHYILDTSPNSWIYEPYREPAYDDNAEVSNALVAVIGDLNKVIPTYELINLGLPPQGVPRDQ